MYWSTNTPHCTLLHGHEIHADSPTVHAFGLCLPLAAVRVLESHEIPLKLQLDHSQKTPYVELRLLQVRDALPPPLMSSTPARGRTSELMRASSEDSLDEDNGHNIVPKEEGKRVVGLHNMPLPSLSLLALPAVIDHGIASVEMMMEEALQDVPSLVKDIQERLRRMEHSYLHMYLICNVPFLHRKLNQRSQGKYMSKQKHCMRYFKWDLTP